MSIAMNRQAVFALFLLVLNTGYFVEALRLPVPFRLGEPGPAFLPLILSAVMFVACGRILYMAMRGIGEPGAEEDEAAASATIAKPVALVLATAGFVYAFEPLGYWIATSLYTFAVATLFELERVPARRAMVLAALVAAGITVAGWLFFVTLFDLFLPAGELLE